MNRAFRRRIIAYIQAQALPPDKFTHQPRLYALAKRVASGQRYDDDIIFAAAWMHDLGVFLGHRPRNLKALARWNHVAYAERKVPDLLRRFGFPRQKIPAVMDAIRTHMPSNDPKSFEAIALRDADILEQLGAVGILRTVSKVGRDTRFVTFSDTLRVLRYNAENLPSQLRLPSARRLAKPRLKVLTAFLHSAEAEAARNGL
jgi:uncharacterized protein